MFKNLINILNKIKFFSSSLNVLTDLRNIKPKFHVSEQGSGRCGHHSQYVETIPHYLLEIPEKYNTDIDIMIEAKMKEQSIFKLYKKYPFLDCKIKTDIVIKIKLNIQ